jgi:nitroreductase
VALLGRSECREPEALFRSRQAPTSGTGSGGSESEALRRQASESGVQRIYNASTLVVIGAAERGPYTDADCWLAAGNLMLAACEGGLGTCCIGFAVAMLNTPEVKAQIGLHANGVAVAPLIVGYASAVPAPVPRAEPTIASWVR